MTDRVKGVGIKISRPKNNTIEPFPGGGEGINGKKDRKIAKNTEK